MANPKQLANQYISALHVNSTKTALIVHSVDESGAYVSAGAGSTQVSIKEILTSSGASVMDSTEGAIKVNVVAGAAGGSTTVTVRQSTAADLRMAALLTDRDAATNVANVTNTTPASTAYALAVREVAQSTGPFQISSIVGAVNMRSSAANALVTVYQSSAAALNAAVVQGSTTWAAQVSSVAGLVRFVANNLADGVVHVGDSTESAIKVNVVAGAAGGSTTVTVRQSTAADLNAAVVQGSTTWVTQVSSVGGLVRLVANNLADGVVHVGDSTEGAIKVNVVAGAAGGSTTVTVRQSTAADLRMAALLTDRDAATNVANVTNTTPASTAYALVVREAAHSTGPFQISSVAGIVTVSTGPMQVSSVGGIVTVSTGPFAVSSIAGPVTVRSSAANALVTVYQSSAADLNVTVAGYVAPSTGPLSISSVSGAVVSRNYTSSGGAVEGSTTAPAVGVIGLHVRQVQPTIQSTTILITSTHSTAIYSLISSAAALRHKVFAYFVGSTHTNPSTLIFCSSISNSGLDHWAVNFGSGSSGISGANLATDTPGFLFGSVVSNALNVKIEGGSSITATCVARISLSWFDEA